MFWIFHWKNLQNQKNGSDRSHMRTARGRVKSDKPLISGSPHSSVYQAKEPKSGLRIEFMSNVVSFDAIWRPSNYGGTRII